MSGVVPLAAARASGVLGRGPYARRLIVWRHHPDVLRRPATDDGEPSPVQALTWNLFRTLELMPPSFWLRRLNAALGALPPRPTPVATAVHIWGALPIPSGLDRRLGDSMNVDVLVESESAVWALHVCGETDVEPVVADGVSDPVALLACGASWYARRRPCYVGLIAVDADTIPLGMALIERYRASASSLHLRLPVRSRDAANVAGFGVVTWRQLMMILQDASTANAVERMEQGMASRSLRWCYDVVPAR